MPAANITRNRKHFVKELLDTKKGEEIINGSADGKASIVPQYHQYYSEENGDKAQKPKEYKMTLFPTNKRIVVYQANGWLKRDKYAQLPLTEIDEISFLKVEERNKLICVTEFIAADDSRYPSIVFKMDCTGHPEDMDQYKVILNCVAKLAGVPIDDYTPPELRD